MGRLRELVKGPGIDTRTWLFYARVDDDDEAVRWDAEVGWLVDVTVVGGQLDGEGPVACRVAWPYAASGAANSSPVQRGVLVACVLPEADLNGTPVIVGMLSTSGEPVPETVNGQDIDEAYAKATHIFVTEYDVQQEVGERWRTSATQRATLEAPEVRLADEDAGQSYVRGEDQKDALDSFLDSFDVWVDLVRLGIIAGGGTLDNTTILQASQTLRTQLAQALSSRIKGE